MRELKQTRLAVVPTWLCMAHLSPFVRLIVAKNPHVKIQFWSKLLEERMANTGKYVSTPQEILEHAAKLEALMSINPLVKSLFFFEAGDVAALLRVDTKTLQRKRSERDAALVAGLEINPLDIASIPYAPPTPTVKYSAQAIEEYLQRVSAASIAPLTEQRSPFSLGARFMGFQAWTTIATPVDEWPFSIRADGRPLDICAAILLGELTGQAERLTLRQFSERLADASGKAFQDRERAELQCVVRPVRTFE